MNSKIRRIWMAWVGAMVLLVAATWALAMVPLPGLSSSSNPTIEDVLGFFRHIGIFGTVKMIAVLFLPPIVLTYLETRETSGMAWPGQDSDESRKRHSH